MDSEPRSKGVDERRQSVRITRPGKVRIQVDASGITGDCENLSPTDVLFYSEQPLRVQVELEEDGQVRTVPGRVVRLEPMQGERSAWAIEFD